MSATVVQSRFQVAHGGAVLHTVLQYLGVAFKRGRPGFWLRNEGELEYIYSDFVKAARARLADLHPDRGGDPESFGSLSVQVDRVKDAFHRRGIGIDRTILTQKEKRPPRKLFLSDEQRAEIKRKAHLATRARQARVRRANRPAHYRAMARARWHKNKANGTQWKPPPGYKVKHSRRARLNSKLARRRWRQNNRAHANMLKRRHHHKHRDRINELKKLKRKINPKREGRQRKGSAAWKHRAEWRRARWARLGGRKGMAKLKNQEILQSENSEQAA